MSCSNSAHACCRTVPARVPEATLSRGVPTHVAVLEDGELVGVGEELGDRDDIAVDIGDDPDPDLVGDLAQRVGMHGAPVPLTVRLGREGAHRLGPSGHAEVVEAGLVEHPRDELDEGGGDRLEAGAGLGEGRHGAVDLPLGHADTLSFPAAAGEAVRFAQAIVHISSPRHRETPREGVYTRAEGL